MKTVGSLWTNNMRGWSATASNRKKTTVEVQATSRAIRAPNTSPNLKGEAQMRRGKVSNRQQPPGSCVLDSYRPNMGPPNSWIRPTVVCK